MTVEEAPLERFNRLQEERAANLLERQEAAAPPPSVQSLCLEQSLYSELQLNPKRDADFLRLLKYGHQQFDAHCICCKKQSTFSTVADRMHEDVATALRNRSADQYWAKQLQRLSMEGGLFALHLACLRNPKHLYSYFFNYDEARGVLTKVGQTPSLEDVAGAEIERYRKILGSEFSELRKATGLFAHGIGIGSFVYLRRIFESMVEEARSKWDPNDEHLIAFNKLRMAERIKELEAFLPAAVVRYKDAYGVLSKGLHELTEAECKQCFPVVRAAIIMMLEQKYEAAEKAKAEHELDRAVAAIVSENKR